MAAQLTELSGDCSTFQDASSIAPRYMTSTVPARSSDRILPWEMELSPRQATMLDSPHEIIAKEPVLNQGKEALKDITFGSIAGIAGKYIEYPFDTVKVRLQSQPDHLPLQYAGPLDCFKKSLQRDGFLGLYRGISAPLFGAAVETSSLFFSYRLSQEALQATILPRDEPLSMKALIFCGAISGAFTSVLLTPIELIKCKVQVPVEGSGTMTSRPSIPSLIWSVYRHQGLLGFWRGQMGTLIRETGGSAAWFGSYEGVSLLFRKSRNLSADEALPVWQQMSAGAAAGMSYNFMFYPADTIKSRMQTEDVSRITGGKQSFWSVTKTFYQQQGLRGLYRGCGITVGRAAPSSAFIFTIYETLRANFA